MTEFGAYLNMIEITTIEFKKMEPCGQKIGAEMEEREGHEEIEGIELSDFTTRPLRRP